MTYDEVMEILETSSPGDWLFFPELNCATCKLDLALRIVLEPTMERYGAAWVEATGKSPAYIIKCKIYYNDSCVYGITLAKVDRGKAKLPIPKGEQMQVSRLDYNVARICDSDKNCDEYMEMFGLNC